MKRILESTLPAVRAIKEALPKIWNKAEAPVVYEADSEQIRAFFYLLGRVTKASGRVTAQHINATESLMKCYIGANQHDIAKEAFREGRDGPEDRRFTVERAFKLYITSGPRWLEPFQVMDGMLRVAMSNGEFTASQVDAVETVRAALGVPIRPFWLLRDTLAKKFGIPLADNSFEGASGSEFEKHRQKVRSDTFGRQKRKADAVFSGNVVTDPSTDFEILELHDGASETEVKAQYRKLVKKYHPDMQPKEGVDESILRESVLKFHEIQEAYSRLTGKS
ncbi:MAG: DnaJ domain-containing protein [Bdellovibrionales bacterium]|nr:DnaJ domain-containing protein [Bdellovibrionales bacterium]